MSVGAAAATVPTARPAGAAVSAVAREVSLDASNPEARADRSTEPEVFVEKAKEHPNCVIGLSCLLTTTMPNMEEAVKAIKDDNPSQIVCIGGAPVHKDFGEKIGADYYAPDPQSAVEFLDSVH